jgi:hypothetical protein
VSGAIVIVLDTLAAPRAPELGERLGAAGEEALCAFMRERTRRWARMAGGGAEPLELTDTDAVAAAVAGHDGPVVAVAPDVPALSEDHLAAVRDDLAAGVLLSSAATGDGTPFLVALSSASPELLDLLGAPFDAIMAAAAQAGAVLGMLRAERRLVSVADARAVLVDPMAPSELRALLEPLA